MESIDSELIRETYAQFGLCLYHIQCIEKSIAISIAQQTLESRNISSTQYDYELSRLFDNTLGQLFVIVKMKNIQFPIEIVNKLDCVLNKRNYIVHDYWWYNSDKLSSNEGFSLMLTELKELDTQFDSFDDLISKETEKYLLKKGIDSQKLESIFQDIIAGRRKALKNHRILKKKEKIVNCFVYMIDLFKKNALLIVELEDHVLCTLGDSGFIPIEIDTKGLKSITKMNQYLPAEANLSPSVNRYWNYYIDLNTRVRIKVFKKDQDNSIIWKIEYPK